MNNNRSGSINAQAMVATVLVLVMGIGIYVGSQQVQDLAYLSSDSRASSGNSLVKPRVCEKCAAGGGIQHCLNRFNAYYDEYKVTKPRWNEKTLLNKAFSMMDSNDKSTPQFDEENCGYCDLAPLRGKNKYGDRLMNQFDVDSYNSMCLTETPTPTIAQPTLEPTTAAADCSMCNFDGVEGYSLADGAELSKCIFTSGINNCINSDINADSKVDAGDLSAANLCIGNASAFDNCRYADRDLNGLIEANDLTILSKCPFVKNINGCYNRDANRDMKIDAGDLSYCNLHCHQSDAVKQEIQVIRIRPGWQIISLYIQPSNTSIETIFSEVLAIPNNEFKVFAYKNGIWKFFYNKLPSAIRTLSLVEPGQGLFIYSEADATINVVGTAISSVIPELSSSQYNLVGITQSSPVAVESAIDMVKYPHVKIWKYTGSNNEESEFQEVYSYNNAYITSPQLEPGVGYWIHTSADSLGQQEPQAPND